MSRVFKLAFSFLASYGFAVVLFVMMMVLVFLGTVEQINEGLFDVQKRYFDSLFVIHKLFGVVPILLPGVYLLLILLVINIICGGIIRIRKGKSTIGVIIGHIGMLMMVFGGFIKYELSIDGHLTLAEHQQSNEFQSYFLWEFAIAQPGPDGIKTEYLIPDEQFASLEPNDSVTFTRQELPFDLTVTGFERNCEPQLVGPVMAGTMHAVDSFILNPKPKEKEAERNVAGAYVTVKDKTTGATQEGIVWGMSQGPFVATVGGKPWAIDLRWKHYELPFAINLDKFVHEKHPRTDVAKTYMSEVTKVENGVKQPVKITMNEPLRHKGYTLYQASFVEANPQTGTPEMSTLAVVHDPADRIPLYSCIVVACGLLIHFILKLLKYLRKENKQRLQTSRTPA